ncbi:hypothetical protein GCM10010435_28200 [Winogradskya consettensis]|uniref:Uncharacterized protein n=1 Tax=Winogradskya consettensis TaxID=113560 RepID=A0A919SEN1_9ACTN|nr:hypothetical protein [Actinoplanes consettensis]GIM71017.1 hypothetical protein Aco04nite_23310 [Actinoplanes consettensis]
MPPIPPIGSAAWDRELTTLGIDRPTVDRELHSAVEDAIAEGTAEPDGHDVYLNDASPETAAVLVLFHQSHPSYSALMYLSFAWHNADGRLRDWIVRQYAAMLVHGPRPVTDSATYGLAIDYFEDRKAAPGFFAALLPQIPTGNWGGLLRAAGPLTWPIKRQLFLTAAEHPDLHEALAEGMAASFFGVYGDISAPEAADLLQHITVADDQTRAALTEATTQPLLMQSGSAIVVTDPRWTHPDSFLLEMTVTHGHRRWSPRSELVINGQAHGRLAHWSFPFHHAWDHLTLPGRTLNKPHLHRIEGTPSDAADLVDREIELWLPGLRTYLAQQR